jgi:hypothetical protein
MEDKTASGIQKQRNTLLYIGILLYSGFSKHSSQKSHHIQIALFQSIPSRGMLFLLFWNIKTTQTLDI